MPAQVRTGDAKTRLSELIARVEKSEEIVVARDNKPVAKLVRIVSDEDKNLRSRRSAP